MTETTQNGTPYNETLLAQLKEYQERENLTNTELGQELSYHATAVSKYFNRKFDRDLAAFEAVAADVLKTAANRKLLKLKLFPTNISAEIDAACELARKTNDFAIVHGPAGIGKTCGFALYHTDHPASILVTASIRQCTARDLEALVWAQLSTTDWDGHERRYTYMLRKLKYSNRPILVDNGHRVKRSGFAWLFDIHDETECPIIVGGNPELLSVIKKNDQMFSRIGRVTPVTTLKKGDEITENVVTQIWPEANGDLNDLGKTVVKNRGHVRALRKQIILARNIAEASGVAPQVAFKSAHTKLIRDYSLS